SRYEAVARQAVGGIAGLVGRHPGAFGRALCAIDLALAPSTEVALVGSPGEAGLAALIAIIRDEPSPYRVVALAHPNRQSAIALLDGRPRVAGQAAAYVCQQFACQAPVTDPSALAALL
ncbi:MAG: thioredoxin domain-containing protein, partial [Cyanobacteria bacterium REEB65]|nr:thioredoxin domain-containing protein [Cyanobacteria bacterium REEB65]